MFWKRFDKNYGPCHYGDLLKDRIERPYVYKGLSYRWSFLVTQGNSLNGCAPLLSIILCLVLTQYPKSLEIRENIYWFLMKSSCTFSFCWLFGLDPSKFTCLSIWNVSDVFVKFFCKVFNQNQVLFLFPLCAHWCVRLIMHFCQARTVFHWYYIVG